MHQLEADHARVAWQIGDGGQLHPDDVAVGARSRHPESFATARMLLRQLVAELAGVDAAAVGFDSACEDCGLPHGKPRVSAPAAARGIHVSVTHACELVVVAASAGHPIGVDAEPAGASAERIAAIEDVAGPSSDAILHWTRVEAVLKADGRGLRVDPRTVRVDGNGATLEGATYRLSTVQVDGFVVSVAVADAEAPEPAG